MKRTKRSLAVGLTSFSLLLTLQSGILLDDLAHAASKTSTKNEQSRSRGDKVASDLRQQMRASKSGQDTVKVILQLDDKLSAPLNALLGSNGIKIKRHFDNFNSFAMSTRYRFFQKLGLSQLIVKSEPLADMSHILPALTMCARWVLMVASTAAELGLR